MFINEVKPFWIDLLFWIRVFHSQSLIWESCVPIDVWEYNSIRSVDRRIVDEIREQNRWLLEMIWNMEPLSICLLILFYFTLFQSAELFNYKMVNFKTTHKKYSNFESMHKMFREFRYFNLSFFEMKKFMHFSLI